jgi:hypothetical protein
MAFLAQAPDVVLMVSGFLRESGGREGPAYRGQVLRALREQRIQLPKISDDTRIIMATSLRSRRAFDRFPTLYFRSFAGSMPVSGLDPRAVIKDSSAYDVASGEQGIF